MQLLSGLDGVAGSLSGCLHINKAVTHGQDRSQVRFAANRHVRHACMVRLVQGMCLQCIACQAKHSCPMLHVGCAGSGCADNGLGLQQKDCCSF